MATTLDPLREDELLDDLEDADVDLPGEDGFGDAPGAPEERPDLRPAVAAGLTAMAAGLVVGGIFDTWAAALYDVVVGVAGTALAVWVMRSKRAGLAQAAVPVVVAVAAVFSVLPGASPGEVQGVVGDAIDAGRLLQIPIPFDPGWRPILTTVFALLGFGSAWVAAATKRPMLGVMLPVPLVALAAISQPTSHQVLAGVFAFVPTLAAFGVLFGGDTGGAGGQKLGRQFEMARLVRGGGAMVALTVLLVVIGRAEFLFPKPAFDPNDRPQKPKSVPLSEQRDRILLTVDGPEGFTGPWRTGVLDVYEDGEWKLPGATPSRLAELPDDGNLPSDTTEPTEFEVTVTTGELGPTAVVPLVPTARRVTFLGDAPDLRFDKRAETLRVPSGRAPTGLTYKVAMRAYPTAEDLGVVPKVTTTASLLEVPPAPQPIQRLLAQAPPGPWAKLDHVRHQLLDNVTAEGAGRPEKITAARVVDMLEGSKRGTPFEIVAAQAMLARWAGIPSRIAFGYNGVNDEDGKLTVRPKNAAQWLEVRFDGYGWLPLLDVPPQAQADLENKDENDDRILPSTDIAVQVFVPVEIDNPRLLFERVRAVLLQLFPVAALLLAVFLSAPPIARAERRRRRERWADPLGPRARVAVAYAEFRDAASDLSVGDPFATPIEYLSAVQEDGEHRELAWLVTRAMYGDLALELTEEDAQRAEEMSASLQRRMRAAQPLQVRVVGFLSRASLVRPYESELPNVTIPSPLRDLRLWLTGLVARRRKVAKA